MGQAGVWVGRDPSPHIHEPCSASPILTAPDDYIEVRVSVTVGQRKAGWRTRLNVTTPYVTGTYLRDVVHAGAQRAVDAAFDPE